MQKDSLNKNPFGIVDYKQRKNLLSGKHIIIVEEKV